MSIIPRKLGNKLLNLAVKLAERQIAKLRTKINK